MELQNLLQRIDALKAELEALLPMDPVQHERLWQKLRLEWNYNSNHIEGNTLTYGETFLLLVHGKTAGDHSVREIDEMRAHNVAINVVRQWADEKERPVLEADIRDLNKLLLKEPFWKPARTADGQETSTHIIPGEYKKEGNGVLQPDGTMFHYARPEEVPAKMMDLMAWSNTKGNDHHPVLLATEWHHRFILIHPFGDGNGRVARLVVNYILLRAGYMPLVVRSADKGQYLTALKKADAGDLNPFAEYLAKQEIWALELALRVARGGDPEERGDWVKEAQVLYERTVTQKEHERISEKNKRALIRKTGEMNFPLMVEECKRIVTAYQKFYSRSSVTVTYRLPYTANHNLPLDVRRPLDDASTEAFIGWLKEEVFPFVVQFDLDFNGDALGSGIQDASIELRWHFEEDQQRFTSSYTPDPNKDMKLLDRLSQKDAFGEYRPYGVSIAAEPLEVFEKAGKWMLTRAHPQT